MSHDPNPPLHFDRLSTGDCGLLLLDEIGAPVINGINPNIEGVCGEYSPHTPSIFGGFASRNGRAIKLKCDIVKVLSPEQRAIPDFSLSS